MIEFKNVTKTFKTDFWSDSFKALDQLNFKIEENSVTGFLGANGAGKTTALKILMKFINYDSGEIIFNKKLGNSFNEIKSKVGYLPERPYFYPYLTGKEFCLLLGKLNRLDDKLVDKRISYWSECFNIDYALNRKIRGYSKGMLQRLGFVVSLIHDPEVIILDEPLSGLDPIGRKEVKDAILKIKKDKKTIFFSSHIVSDVQEVCDNVIFIEAGKLIYQGSIEKILDEHLKAVYDISFRLANLNLKDLPKNLIINDLENKKNHRYLAETKTNNKDELLKTLLNLNAEIIKVDKKQLSLEEIFYNVKNISIKSENEL